MLAAQQAAWLSLWELKRVVAGEGFELHDLLTSETLWVANQSASRSVPEDGVLLARVARCDGENLLSAHPVVLSFRAAVDVAERMRKYLRSRSVIAPERLQHPNSVRYLLKRAEPFSFTLVRGSAAHIALSNPTDRSLHAQSPHCELYVIGVYSPVGR